MNVTEQAHQVENMLPHDGTRRGLLYPNLYAWFVFISFMDVLLTWAILILNGEEVNPLAAFIMSVGQSFGGDGGQYVATVVFKLFLTITVILICDFIGRGESEADFRKGKRLAQLAVAISAIPICWSLTLLATRLG